MMSLLAFGGAAVEFIAAGVGIAEPEAGDEIRGLGFEGVEVMVQRQKHKDILLGIVPAALGAVRQQAIDHFGDQVTLRVIADQRIQQDGVGAAVGAEQQVGLVIVGGGEVGRPGGFDHVVVHEAADLLQLRFVIDHRPQPADGFHRKIIQAGIPQQFQGLLRVAVAG